MTREEILESYELNLDTVERFRKMGMISPKRMEDGALVYSHENGEMLQRLLLLEKMGFSEDDFFKLKSGDKTLKALIERQLGRLEDGCLGKEISRQILEEGGDFQSFDAKKYLRQLDDDAMESAPFTFNSGYRNQVYHPWRRFFARIFDEFIYGLIWYVFLGYVCHVNLSDEGFFLDVFDTVIGMVLMLFIEPFLLNRFGTTLGKKIFGLRITKGDGTYLSYAEGLKRTWVVIGKGEGYNIPIYNLIRLYESYKLCKAEEIQPWDEGISYTIKDTKGYRVVVWIGMFIIYSTILYLVIGVQQLPPNRGEITLAEFAENYNYSCKFLDLNEGWYMDENGKLVDEEEQVLNVNSIGTISINDPAEERPSFEYEIEDGYLKGVSFVYEVDIVENMTNVDDIERTLITHAFGCTDKSVGLFTGNELTTILPWVLQDKDNDFMVGNTRYFCHVEKKGYYEEDIITSIDGDERPYYKIEFFVTKE